MRKLFVTSGLVLCAACPAFADIAAGTSTADCVQSVLGSYTGPVSFSSVYRPAIGVISLDSGIYESASAVSPKYNTTTGGVTGASPSTIYSVYGVGIFTTQPTSQNVSDYTSASRTTSITIPSRDGYTFDGFYTQKFSGGSQMIENDGDIVYEGASTAISSDTNNAVWYAHWTVNTYSISYVLDYTGAPTWTNDTTHPTTATYDTAFNVVNPTRTGYTFNGWNITGMDTTTHYRGTTSSPSTSFSTDTASSVTDTYFKNLRATSGTVTFTATSASWTAKSDKTVTYNCGVVPAGATSAGNSVGGTAPTASSNPTYDSSYSLATTAGSCAGVTGYHFGGWRCDYNMADGSANTVTEQNTASTPNYASTFANNAWTVSATVSQYKVDANMTCTAIWVANTINLNWYEDTVANGATTPFTTGSCTYDTTFDLPTNYTQKNGYHYNGWTVR